ncbi:SMI1/KNR4 family protein [uncultured Sphingomonas sp.]|uniref:SMI1/KNR4 family protein n=1 Tax=uncultured Sphingomonas sp. TaxID=158754 RepID=UPI0025E87C25|nr:SMI1/KNR4 family protein [uncultured Sphingomonas sp.]
MIRTRAEPVREAYVGDGLRLPDDADRARIEGAVGARLPDDYRELVVAHQGQVLVADPVAVPEQGKVDFGVLLLALSPAIAGDDASYCIERCQENMRDYYPAGLLPFADDTGGNYWAFDFRQSQDRPAVVFIDHEIEGEEGVTPVAPDFAGFRARWIDAAA